MKNYLKCYSKFLTIQNDAYTLEDNSRFYWNLVSIKKEFFNTHPQEDWTLDTVERFKQSLIIVAETSNYYALVRELKLEGILT